MPETLNTWHKPDIDLTMHTCCRPSKQKLCLQDVSLKASGGSSLVIRTAGQSLVVQPCTPCTGSMTAPTSGPVLVSHMSKPFCKHCYNITRHIW